MRIVLDASAAVRLVMRDEAAERLLEPIASAVVVLAPSLFASEVANALWKYVQAGNLDLDTALERYEEAIHLIDDFTPDWELTTEAITEATRYRHPVYDLLYAILARRKGCAMLTMDQRLTRCWSDGHCDRPGIGPPPDASRLPAAAAVEWARQGGMPLYPAARGRCGKTSVFSPRRQLMVSTGSLSSPGPTISFSVVTRPKTGRWSWMSEPVRWILCPDPRRVGPSGGGNTATPLPTSRAAIGADRNAPKSAMGCALERSEVSPQRGAARSMHRMRQQGVRSSGEVGRFTQRPGEGAGDQRVQSSSGKRMVITGSPSSPGPTISFNVVSAASVDLPSRGTR